MSERTDRPTISHLRPEIAHPERASWLESVGIRILDTPFAARRGLDSVGRTKDKILSWRMPQLRSGHAAVGGIVLAALAISLGLNYLQATPSIDQRAQATATATPDRRPTPTVGSRNLPGIGSFTTDSAREVRATPPPVEDPFRSPSRFTELFLTGKAGGNSFGLENAVGGGWRIGVDFNALKSLVEDPLFNIEIPEDYFLFSYIVTNFSNETKQKYNKEDAERFVSKYREEFHRVGVVYLGFDTARYRQMHADFRTRYNLPPVTDNTQIALGLSYDWLMSLQEDLYGNNPPIPSLSDERVRKLMEYSPFAVTFQNPPSVG